MHFAAALGRIIAPVAVAVRGQRFAWGSGGLHIYGAVLSGTANISHAVLPAGVEVNAHLLNATITPTPQEAQQP